jgi:Tol biopolymer transport system component/DNA-binding winged helix-turn-helix (wHTH) protein
MKFDSFELDPQAYVLRNAGHAVKLERIPMELLLLLASSRGRLLTREEIVAHIWGKDRFLDSESAVNTAMRKLRNALGEDPEHPKYIETVPRRGYRFIADVADLPHHPSTPNGSPSGRNGSITAPNGSAGVANGSAGAATTRVATQDAELAIAPGPLPKLHEMNGYEATVPVHSPSRRRRLKWALPVAGVAVLLLIALAVWIRRPRLPVVTNAVQITNDSKAKLTMNLPVTDGVRLYFVEGTPWTTGSGIAQQSIVGGETTWITTSLEKILAIDDISPDRSKLLVAAGAATNPDAASEIWVQPLPAGAPYRVGEILASTSCWTPDGKHILFAYRRVITIAKEDGSDGRPLASVSGIVRALRFSPDGKRIRFYLIQPQGDSTSLWEMDANGGNLHPLLPNWKGSEDQCCGSWSPDGNYYYFEAGRGTRQSIWALPERRSILYTADRVSLRLTSGPISFGAPVPSLDGKRLFVVGNQPRVELFRFNQQTHEFDPYLKGISGGSVDFSRDGKWITYVSYPDMSLWRSRPDGSEKMQLTFPPVRAYGARWSPDGSRIAFGDVQFHRPWKISVIPSSGGGSPELPVEASSDAAETDPTWTPDGKSIIFARSESAGEGKGMIYRLDLSSGKIFPIPGSQGFRSPRLSPDGRYICAFTDDGTKLMLFDASTNHWSSLATGELGMNEWSHDGKYVYVKENRSGASELVRVRIKDHVLEPIASLKDFPQLVDAFAAWFGLTPDDSPLLMRDRSIQEIYALDLRFR